MRGAGADQVGEAIQSVEGATLDALELDDPVNMGFTLKTMRVALWCASAMSGASATARSAACLATRGSWWAFHVVPGGRYTRMYGQDYNPHTYGYMGSCVDYKHWAGGDWTTSRTTGVGGTGVVLTKTDGDARGGAALSVRQITGQPILFMGTGEKVTDFAVSA